MPDDQSNSLKIAAQIEDVKKKIEEAVQARQVAETNLANALAAVNVASSDPAAARRSVELASKTLADSRAYEELQRNLLHTLLSPREPSDPPWVGQIIQYGIFSLLALIVLIFLLYGIISQHFLPLISVTPTARGLITFLVAFATVTIAIILALATVVSDSPDADGD